MSEAQIVRTGPGRSTRRIHRPAPRMPEPVCKRLTVGASSSFQIFWTPAQKPTRKVAVFQHGHAGHSDANPTLLAVKRRLWAEGWNILSVDRVGADRGAAPRDINDRPTLAHLCFGRGLDWVNSVLTDSNEPLTVLTVGFSEGVQFGMYSTHRWAATYRGPNPGAAREARAWDWVGQVNVSGVPHLKAFGGLDPIKRQWLFDALLQRLKAHSIAPTEPITACFDLLEQTGLDPFVLSYLQLYPHSVGRYLQMLEQEGCYDYTPQDDSLLIRNPANRDTLNVNGAADEFVRGTVPLLLETQRAQSALSIPPRDRFVILGGGHQLEGSEGLLADEVSAFLEQVLAERREVPAQVPASPFGLGYEGVSYFVRPARERTTFTLGRRALAGLLHREHRAGNTE